MAPNFVVLFIITEYRFAVTQPVSGTQVTPLFVLWSTPPFSPTTQASSPLNVMSYESVYVMGLVAFLNDHESPALTAEIDISTAVTDMSLCPSNLASWQMKPKTWHPGTG
eukprot:1751320-Pyramimonas_sp.AAC.1